MGPEIAEMLQYPGPEIVVMLERSYMEDCLDMTKINKQSLPDSNKKQILMSMPKERKAAKCHFLGLQERVMFGSEVKS